MNKKRNGFTLIELVVVMAIIAILALIIVAAIQAARRQSINSQRVGNVQAVETALEARFARCGVYVGEGRCAAVASGLTGEIEGAGLGALEDALKTEKYLSQNLSGDLDRGYNYDIKGQTLVINACEFGAGFSNVEDGAAYTGEDVNCIKDGDDTLYSAIR